MQDNRLRDALGFALVRTFRGVNRAHNRALRPFGLSAEQAHVLIALWLEGPMKVGELQRLLALSSATLTGAIDRMEKAGLVRRVPDPDDRRAFRVEPARIEARRRRAVEDTLEETEERCFSTLTGAERRKLYELLGKIMAGLSAE
jgi:DNA-binding MarR family transcriptional regulator